MVAHAEEIAFYDGVGREKNYLQQIFGSLLGTKGGRERGKEGGQGGEPDRREEKGAGER